MTRWQRQTQNTAFPSYPSIVFLYDLAVFVTHLSAKVCHIDRWLLAGSVKA